MAKIETASVLIRVPVQLKDRLTNFAEKQEKKVTHVVLDAVRAYLEANDD